MIVISQNAVPAKPVCSALPFRWDDHFQEEKELTETSGANSMNVFTDLSMANWKNTVISFHFHDNMKQPLS